MVCAHQDTECVLIYTISFSNMEKYNIYFTFFPKVFLSERFDIFPIGKLMEKYIPIRPAEYPVEILWTFDDARLTRLLLLPLLTCPS